MGKETEKAHVKQLLLLAELSGVTNPQKPEHDELEKKAKKYLKNPEKVNYE